MSQRLHRIEMTRNHHSKYNVTSLSTVTCDVFLCRMFVFPSQIIGLVSLNTSSVVDVNTYYVLCRTVIAYKLLTHTRSSSVDILVRNRSVDLKVISLQFFQDIPFLNNEFKSCRNCCCFRDCPGI